jgi:hypothetical protein
LGISWPGGKFRKSVSSSPIKFFRGKAQCEHRLWRALWVCLWPVAYLSLRRANLFQPVLQQPDHATFEVDRLHAIEARLIGIVFGQYRLGDTRDFRFHRRAVRLGTQILHRSLQTACILPGDLGVAFLVALDVGRKGVPDHGKVTIGAPPLGPAGQDDVGVERDARAFDGAAAGLLGIGDAPAELHFRGAGMTRAGAPQ